MRDVKMKFKTFFKKILPKFIVSLLKNFIFTIKLYLYNKEIKKREKYSIFNYKELAKDMELVTKEYGYNSFYGLADIVKKVEGLPLNKPLDAAIEHGAIFGLWVNEIDKKKNVIYAFGEWRKKYLQKKFPEKTIYCISPYIQYVDYNMDIKELNKLKEKFGKTLLVFPDHSTHHINITFDFKSFIDEIERVRIRYNFKTVLVCIYWKDILNKMHKKFEVHDYKICTAGHIYDTNFLKRLKSIIYLSDVVMGNNLGTYIGYSLFLGKPFYYYPIDTVETSFDGNGESVDNARMKNVYDIVSKNFAKYKEYITKDDIKFVEDFWGNKKYKFEKIM